MIPIATPAELHESLRGDIESEFNGLRDAIVSTYATAQRDLENEYHADLLANRLAKEDALAEAGLNRDGSDPYGRPSDA